MQTVFAVMFGVGLGYSLIAFVLGEVIGAIDSDFSFGGTVSPLQPTVIAAFVTVFGGSGLILMRHVAPMPAISLAGLLAMGVSYSFYRLVIIPLNKAQNTSAIEIQSLIGHTAKVTVKIPQGQFGKITYYVNGNTYSAPAKSEDGNEIPRDANVEIIYIDKNTYYVRKES